MCARTAAMGREAPLSALPDRWVRASIGAIVTEAQHVQGSTVLGHRRLATYPGLSSPPKVSEQSAVQHRLEHAPQTLQLERVCRSELNLDPAVVGLLSGDRQEQMQRSDSALDTQSTPWARSQWSPDAA